MSKSLKRVRQALVASGLDYRLEEMRVETRTAQQAADALGCELDQIAKSIIVVGSDSGQAALFLTAGGNRVDLGLAGAVLGEQVRVLDASAVRRITGFAIGGVAPLGHLTPVPTFADPRLSDFVTVWAAAGTPRHVFEMSTTELLALIGAQTRRFVS